MSLTLDQLKALSWLVENVNAGEHVLREYEPIISREDAYGNLLLEQNFFSYIKGECRVTAPEAPGVVISLWWIAMGGRNTLAEAYTFTVELCEELPGEIHAEGQTAVGRAVNALSLSEEEEFVQWLFEEGIDWGDKITQLLPTLAPEELEPYLLEPYVDATCDQPFQLQRDDGPDVQFSGKEAGYICDYEEDGPLSLRWEERRFYQTRGGQWVCHEVNKSAVEGERDLFSVLVEPSIEELWEVLGRREEVRDLATALLGDTFSPVDS